MRDKSSPAQAEEARWRGHEDNARLAFWLQLVIPPFALVLAWLMTGGDGLGSALSRIFFSMWIHELGHATAAWMSGRLAFPGPWMTPVGEEPSWMVRAFVVGSLAFVAWRAHDAARPTTTWLCVALLACFGWTSFLASHAAQDSLILFMGDGGAMLLGAVLVLTVHAPGDHALSTRWLKWGFVVIGSVAWADSSHVWWAALSDPAAIPFGMNEGQGLSDASRLVDEMGWSERALVRRFVVMSTTCLLLMACGHGLGVWSAWRTWQAHSSSHR